MSCRLVVGRVINAVSFRTLHKNRDKGIPMPKGNQKNKTKDPRKQCSGDTPKEPAGPVQSNADGTVTVHVIAKPSAKQNAITDITPEGVGIQIAAPPVDGEANSEIVKYLAKLLGVRKSDVTLHRGSKSRSKSFILTGTSKTLVDAKLSQEASTS